MSVRVGRVGGRRRGALVVLWVVTLGAAGCDKARSPIRDADGWLEASTGELDFGATTLGVPVTRDVTLAQRGLVAADIAGSALEPAAAPWKAATLPGSVATDGAISLRLVFLPVAAGPDAATWRVEGGISQLEFKLSGRGVDARAAPQNPLEFGRPALGAVRRRELRLRNDAETAVPVSLRPVGAHAAEFSLDRAELWVGPFSEASVPIAWQPAGSPGVRDAGIELKACPLCAPERLPVSAEAVAVPLVVTPDPVVFGNVPFDVQGRRLVTITNATDETITLGALTLEQADAGYQFASAPMPFALAPLASTVAEITFSPVHAGGATASLELRSDAQPTPDLSIAVRAGGGGAQLVVTPGKLDYRTIPAGSRRSLVLTVENAGDPGAPALTLGAIAVEGDAYALLAAPAPGTALPVRTRLEVEVVFQPAAPGSYAGVVRIPSDDPLSPEIVVPLSGAATAPVVCDLLAQPSPLEFGGVRAGKRAILAVKLFNVGAEPCSLWNERLEGDPAFEIVKVRPLVWLDPGQSMPMPIGFKPPASGRYTAELVFDGNTAAGGVRVPLAGGSDGQPCLVPQPSALDFGGSRPECPAPEQIATWLNRCSSPVTVTSIALGEGTDPGAFVLESATTTPATVAPGATVQARIRFAPTHTGRSWQALFAQGSDSPLPVLLPLEGEAQPTAARELERVQPATGKLDVLLVLDNTASMKSKREALQRSMAGWLAHADGMRLDYHVGTTTTGIDRATPGLSAELCLGGVEGGEAGRLFPVDGTRPRYVTPTTANRAGVLAANLDVGGCHTVKQGLEAAKRALSSPLVDNADHPRTPERDDGNLGFARDDARLAVVVWSDDDDQSPGSLGSRIGALAALRPQTPMSFNAVVAPAGGCNGMTNPGVRYITAAQRLGGFTTSVCEPDWSGPAKALVDAALQPYLRYPLGGAADPATLVVTVDGAPAGNWSYDAAAQAVVFASAPPAGARLRFSWTEPCAGP